MANKSAEGLSGMPHKRRRRTKAEMQEIRDEIFKLLEEHQPMNVRGVFYQATTMKSKITGETLVRKTQSECDSNVGRLLVQMRRDGTIPFWWIADATRWMRKPTTHNSIRDALEETVRCYRRALWNDLDAYVEIWVEKAGLAGTIYDVTSEWDVPLMACGGYPSHSFLYAAAENIEAIGKATFVYYLGDHDPSGRDIDRFVKKSLEEYAPGTQIHFERVAVTREQIRRWHLPTRPTKKTDSRSKTFRGKSVELDAIRADRLRDLVRDCIERHVNPRQLRKLQVTEEAERETAESLVALIDTMHNGQASSL